jgi:hypothetical protein
MRNSQKAGPSPGDNRRFQGSNTQHGTVETTGCKQHSETLLAALLGLSK